MSLRVARILVPAALVSLGYGVAWLFVDRVPPPARAALEPLGPLPTTLARREAATINLAAWGEFRRHLRGHTHGLKDVVVSQFTLKPGQAPHPPHQHADEELLILVDGAGTLHLDGKDSPVRKGDIAYAAPWAMHGLRNSGDAPLTYYVLKWNGKAVKPAAKPAAPPPASAR